MGVIRTVGLPSKGSRHPFFSLLFGGTLGAATYDGKAPKGSCTSDPMLVYGREDVVLSFLGATSLFFLDVLSLIIW